MEQLPNDMHKRQLLIEGYNVHRTCHACPEQYDVFDQNGMQVAYLRLRHGSFRVDVPDCGGETILQEYPNGDGIFDNNERLGFLKMAVAAIQHYYANRLWDKDDADFI